MLYIMVDMTSYLSLFDLDALQRCDPERQQFVIFVV